MLHNVSQTGDALWMEGTNAQQDDAEADPGMHATDFFSRWPERWRARNEGVSLLFA